MDYIYTLTVMMRAGAPHEIACVGWYKTEGDVYEDLLRDKYWIFGSGNYDLAVIEKVSPGSRHRSEEVAWIEIDGNGNLRNIPKPDYLSSVCGWSMEGAS